MKRLFEIQTLSECCSPRLKDYTRLAQFDPASIILGIGTIIPGLFPNLFGSERTSIDVFNKLFPSNGYWTSAYKNYLLSKIRYIKDIQRDLHQYTGEFIVMNLNTFCPGQVQNAPGGEKCWENFYQILTTEGHGGGIQPPPGTNYQTLLLVGGGVLLLLALSKKKRGSKK